MMHLKGNKYKGFVLLTHALAMGGADPQQEATGWPACHGSLADLWPKLRKIKREIKLENDKMKLGQGYWDAVSNGKTVENGL